LEVDIVRDVDEYMQSLENDNKIQQPQCATLDQLYKAGRLERFTENQYLRIRSDVTKLMRCHGLHYNKKKKRNYSLNPNPKHAAKQIRNWNLDHKLLDHFKATNTPPVGPTNQEEEKPIGVRNVRTQTNDTLTASEEAIIARQTSRMELLPLTEANDVELANFCRQNRVTFVLPREVFPTYTDNWTCRAVRTYGTKKGRNYRHRANIMLECVFTGYMGDRKEISLADQDWATEKIMFDVSRYKMTKEKALTVRDLIAFSYPQAHRLHDLLTEPTRPHPDVRWFRPSQAPVPPASLAPAFEEEVITEPESVTEANAEASDKPEPKTKEIGIQADEWTLKEKVTVFAKESTVWGEPKKRTYATERELLHNRFGHTNMKKVDQIMKEQRRQNGKRDRNEENKLEAKEWMTPKCEICSCNKATRPRKIARSQRKRHATQYLGRVHMDESGTLMVPSYNGAKYYTVFVDEFTRYKWTYVHSRKSDALLILQMFLIDAESDAPDGEKVQKLRVDQAGEHLSEDYINFLHRKGIKLECSCARNHYQNGVAEKAIRDVAEMARTMMNNADAPRDLWGYAVRYATYIQNRLPTETLYDKEQKRNLTPYEKKNGSAPDLQHIKVFGCQATVPFEKGESFVVDHKFDQRGAQGMFVGRAEDGGDVRNSAIKGDVIWCLEGGPRVIVTAEAKCDECIFPRMLGPVQWEASVMMGEKTDVPIEPPTNPWKANVESVDGTPYFLRNDEVTPEYDDQGILGCVVTRLVDGKRGLLYKYDRWRAKWLIKYEDEDEIVSSSMLEVWNCKKRYAIGSKDRKLQRKFALDELVEEEKRMRKKLDQAKKTREKEEERLRKQVEQIERSTKKIQLEHDKTARAVKVLRTKAESLCAEYDDVFENEQMARRDKSKRSQANVKKVKTEEAPIKSRIYEPRNYDDAMRCPEHEKWREAIHKEIQGLLNQEVFRAVKAMQGKRSIDSKLIFKVKYNPDGTVDKYKVRYVVRGDRQKKGLDYDQIFAPVSHHALARTLLSVACALDLEIHLCDVTQAFLHAPLEEEVYMRPAKGVCEVMGLEPGTWLKLEKSLYGLKQAPRNWNKEFNQWLRSQRFRRCGEDDCLFAREEIVNGRKVVILLLEYVDDFIMVSNDIEGLQQFKDEMNEKYKHDGGAEIEYYLGVEVERDREKKTLALHQTKYTQDLLDGVEEKKGKLKLQDTPLSPGMRLLKHDGEPIEQSWYRSVIGTLIYLSGWTRPDIQFAVGELAGHVSNPGPDHHKQLLHLLGYLKKTKGMRIQYTGNLKNTGYRINELVAFCDASFAGDPETWRSRTGFVTMLNGGPISWKSKVQTIVAQSTTDAEIEAAVKAIKDVLSLRIQLYYLGLGQREPTKIFEDNAATICISMNASLREATKHLGYRRAFLRDHVEKQHVILQTIATSEQTADIFTKALARIPFERHRDQMLKMMPNKMEETPQN
jgi:hypothetical protein